ncbi:hypothetical protein [Falsirhodobacter sp. alg1]|uniref:hypothetical protein n=1 Tax=Falsirhodobacter sp. alg1 TaxID=1472418 RepID=UPI000789A4DA|nr:hypothetical protein [Falsirhodobacter sp. alg1]
MVTLVQEGWHAGTWHGVLHGAEDDPGIHVVHRGELLENISVMPEGEGVHRISVPVPVELLDDGMHTFLIRLEDGTVAGHFNIATTSPDQSDMQAELAALRAELDLLRRAFRRHCMETLS